MIIRELRIKNFRSLRDLKLNGLGPSVVLHGANNSGKSNILLALEIIFSAKFQSTGVDLPADMSGITPPPPSRKTPFWNGVIFDFADNFYMGTQDEIAFWVRLEVPPSQFERINDVGLLNVLLRPGHNYQVKMAGKITRAGADGDMVLDTVELNNRIVFHRKKENVEWLPWIKSPVEPAQRQRLGENILDSFTDSVQVIPADRYLTTEEVQGKIPSLKSSSYKNWLHYQSLSREGFEIFKSVKQQLGEKPFRHGDISFLKNGENIEIMVDDGCGFRMPIAQKGTGIQQILVLLGFMRASRAHVIGIEEPEINLSFKSQDDLITTLLKLLPLNSSRVTQILLASHSDQVGSRSELKQIHVENPDGKGTTTRTFTVADRAALFPRGRRFKRTV